MKDEQGMDDYNALYSAFFLAHPEHFNGVQFLPMPGSDEPEMCFSTDTVRAFIRWAFDQGHIRHQDKVPALLGFLAHVEEQAQGTRRDQTPREHL